MEKEVDQLGEERRYLIGSYTTQGGQGITEIVASNGKLRKGSSSAEMDDPIWLTMNSGKKRLYAVGSLNGQGTVASYKVENGLQLQAIQKTGGREGCHLCFDAVHQTLYSANYVDGSISVFPLDADGDVLPERQHVTLSGPLGPNPRRQEGHHAHECVIRPGGNELFVCDLGADRVRIYAIEAEGTLTEKDEVLCPAGTGPRHLLFDGSGRFFLVGELGGWLMTCEEKNRSFEVMECISTLPDDIHAPDNTAAAIRRRGNDLLVTNRGHNSIARFTLKDGIPRWNSEISCRGSFPRDLWLEERQMLVANQKAGGVVLMNEEGRILDALPDLAAVVCILGLEE